MKKRIALGVVAALAGGLLAAAPASAAAIGTASYPFVVTTADTGVTADGETATATMAASQVAGSSNYIAITGATTAVGVKTTVTLTGGTVISASVNTAGDETPTVNAAATQVTYATGKTVGSVIKVATSAAGTITAVVAKVVEAPVGQFTTTTLQTFTFTATASAVGGVATAANSTAYIAAGSDDPASADSATVVGINTAAGSAIGTIEVQLRDGNKAAVAASSSKPISISVEGPGYIKTETGTASTSLTGHLSSLGTASDFSRGALLTNGSGARIKVYGDGTSGVGKVTIKYGDLSWTKSVTFYGAVAKLTAVVKKAYVSNAAATSAAILVSAFDANNVLIPSKTVTVTSSDETILAASGVTGLTSAAASDSTAGVSVQGVATKSGKVTLTFKSADVTTVTTTAEVTVANAVAYSAALAWDKAEYAPGDKATVTVTLKDKAGNPLADGSYLALTSAGIAYSANVGGASSNETVTTTAGVAKYTVYVPLAAGPLTASATTGSTAAVAADLQATAISASAKVAAPASAAETANAAAIATLNTAVATLQTTVASLVASMTAQIKVINSALVKIAKKLKVKI